MSLGFTSCWHLGMWLRYFWSSCQNQTSKETVKYAGVQKTFESPKHLLCSRDLKLQDGRWCHCSSFVVLRPFSAFFHPKWEKIWVLTCEIWSSGVSNVNTSLLSLVVIIQRFYCTNSIKDGLQLPLNLTADGWSVILQHGGRWSEARGVLQRHLLFLILTQICCLNLTTDQILESNWLHLHPLLLHPHPPPPPPDHLIMSIFKKTACTQRC